MFSNVILAESRALRKAWANPSAKLEKALSLDKNLAIANNDLAYYYMLDAQPIDMKKAEQCLQKALKAFPNHCVFLDTYAEFYLYQKKIMINVLNTWKKPLAIQIFLNTCQLRIIKKTTVGFLKIIKTFKDDLISY